MMQTFGPQDIGREETQTVLGLIMNEITRRENDRSFQHMKTLTWISIGLAALQVLIAAWQSFSCR